MERRYEIRKHRGAIRVLDFLLHADADNYAKALLLSEESWDKAGRNRHSPRGHAEVRSGREHGSGIDTRYRRVLAAGLERRQN